MTLETARTLETDLLRELLAMALSMVSSGGATMEQAQPVIDTLGQALAERV